MTMEDYELECLRKEREEMEREEEVTHERYTVIYDFVPTPAARRDGMMGTKGKEKVIWAKDSASAKKLFQEKYGEFALAGNFYGTYKVKDVI